MNLEGKTISELMELRRSIESNPASRNTPRHGAPLWIYNSKARKKLDAIDWAITRRMAEARAESGNLVPCDGYSGRQLNK